MPTQDPRAAGYVPPATITVTPPTFLIADRNTAGNELVVILDTETGRLHAERNTGGNIHDRGPAYRPNRDLYFPGAGHEWWNRSARFIGWTPSHWPAYPGTADSFRAALDLMARWAKELVDALEPLPGGDWDWTLRASAAYERVGYLVSYGPGGMHKDKAPDPGDLWFGDGTEDLPERHHYGAVSFDEVLAAAPADWPQPAWATLGDRELDMIAATITNPYRYDREIPEHLRARVGHEVEERLKARIQFSKPFKNDPPTLAERNRSMPIHVLGARAGLRRYRARLVAEAAGHPAEHAAVFLLGNPEALPATLRAASSDAEVDRIAEVLDAEVAAEHRLALVATPSVLRAARAEMRALKRAELAAAGDAYTHMNLELRQLGDRRAGLLLEVASFQDGPEWDAEKSEPNYAELGRLARMTRQAARERVLAGEPVPAVPDDDVAAAIREHLRETRANLSAAQLYEHVTGAAGLFAPREQLDRVLLAMHRAGDVGKDGTVGPTYYNPRR
jgi:hypothetical protein